MSGLLWLTPRFLWYLSNQKNSAQTTTTWTDQGKWNSREKSAGESYEINKGLGYFSQKMDFPPKFFENLQPSFFSFFKCLGFRKETQLAYNYFRRLKDAIHFMLFRKLVV